MDVYFTAADSIGKILERRSVEIFNTTDIPKSARITRLVDHLYERKCGDRICQSETPVTESYQATERTADYQACGALLIFCVIFHHYPWWRKELIGKQQCTIAPRLSDLSEFSYQWLGGWTGYGWNERERGPVLYLKKTKQELEVHKYWKGRPPVSWQPHMYGSGSNEPLDIIFLRRNYFYNSYVGNVTIKYERKFLLIG